MTTKERAAFAADLCRDEGVRAFPYTDTVGKLTIGVGRNLTDRGLRADEITFLLQNDIDEVLADVDRAFPWARHLDPVRYRVLANMCFNLGVTKLRGFSRTLAAVERGDYMAAAAGMRASRWARQVGARAERLAVMMETGAA